MPFWLISVYVLMCAIRLALLWHLNKFPFNIMQHFGFCMWPLQNKLSSSLYQKGKKTPTKVISINGKTGGHAIRWYSILDNETHKLLIWYYYIYRKYQNCFLDVSQKEKILLLCIINKYTITFPHCRSSCSGFWSVWSHWTSCSHLLLLHYYCSCYTW